MTPGSDFIKKGKCKNIHCSSVSISAWCDLNSKGDIIKLHDKCPNPKCNCQKLLTFSPHEYMLESESMKSKLQKRFKWRQTARNKFLKPDLKMAKTLISSAIAAKTKNPQSAPITNNFLRSLRGGKSLSLTDMHVHGLRLKVK